MKQILKGSKCYLIGPMDDVSDGGEGWRKIAAEKLMELGIGVLNPTNKAIGNGSEEFTIRQQTQQKKILAAKAKRNGDIATFQKLGNEIRTQWLDVIGIDFRMIDISDFNIMYIDKNVHMCGSYSEQTMACLQRKPIVVFCNEGIENITNWIWGHCDFNYFHDSLSSALEQIERIHIGVEKPSKKWKIFDFDKIYNNN